MNKLFLIIVFSIVFIYSCDEDRAMVDRNSAIDYVSRVKRGEVESYKPKDGFVPNKEVAISIAVSVWEVIYGKDQIADQAPYTAHLVDNIWMVSGSLKQNTAGGTATALISKDSGKVLHIIHHK